MLDSLARQLKTIEAEALPEAEIYRQERLHEGLRRMPARERRHRDPGGVLQCPICGTQARRFLPFGLAGRRNARCPVCGSVERHRFLWRYLTRATGWLHQRLRVLHTAPEACLEHRFRALPNWRYRSVDRFDPAADILADLRALPLATGSQDLILTSHTLEHIPDDRAAIRELGRVTRPGGVVLVMVPFDPRLQRTLEDPANDTPARRMAAYGHPYHYRIYGADLIDRLAEAGFDATVVESKRWLTPHQRRRYRINRNHLLTCRRR